MPAARQSKPTNDEDARRTGAEDYDRFLAILRGELDRVIEPLQRAINETREDVRALRKETYTREMMDEKLKVITDDVRDQGEQLKLLHQMVGNTWQQLGIRVAGVAAFIYYVTQAFPHLFHF